MSLDVIDDVWNTFSSVFGKNGKVQFWYVLVFFPPE